MTSQYDIASQALIHFATKASVQVRAVSVSVNIFHATVKDKRELSLKKIQMTMASTHVDLHGDKLTKEALQSIATQVNERYTPINVNHDILQPPVGRLISAKVVELPDGEFALCGVGELFEESDTSESMVGDGRKTKIEDDDIRTISVGYDRGFRDENGKELLSRLSKISGEEPTPTVKKALEPIQVLLIAAGVFVIGEIASGFLKKLGSDMYEKLRDALAKYYGKNSRPDQRIDFRLSVRKDKRVLEIHTVIDEPTEAKLDGFFTSGFEEVDALLKSLPLDEEMDLAELVLEFKEGKLRICYATRKDCVPFEFRLASKKPR